MASKETESRKTGNRDRVSRGFSMMTPEEQVQAINDGSVEAQLEAAKRRKLELLEAQRLYQKNHALEFFVPQAQQQEFFQCFQDPKVALHLLLGGNRCLGKDEEIFDPVSNITRKVSEIKEPFHVVAWDGSKLVTASADIPYEKGMGKLIRVHLSSGQSFACAPEHRLFQQIVFAPASKLIEGAEVCLLPTTLDTSRLVHDEGAQSFWKTAQDFLSDYLAYLRLCGEQLPPAVEIVPDAFPSLLDVLTRIGQSESPFYGHQDGLACKPECSHFCQLFYPPSIRDDLPLPLVRFADILFHAACKLCRRASDSPPAARLSTLAFDLLQSIHELALQASHNPYHFFFQALESPLGVNRCGHVVKIEEIEAGVKWDFEVPGYANYFHKGMIHHNSGKSAALVAAACSLGIGRYPWVKPPAKLPPPVSIQVRSDGSLLVDGQIYASDQAYKQHRKELERDQGLMRVTGRPLKIRIIAEDYAKAIGQTILPKFFEFMPPELIASKRKGQTGVYDQVVLTFGTVYDFLTYAQDSAMMEGWDGDAVFYDEPPPRPIFIANARGLVDRNGVSVFAMTPLKEPWIANELVNNPNANARVYKLRSYDNPHIDKDALDRFVGLLSDEEKQTRTEGEFLHLQGLVFKEFKKSTHVIKPFAIPKHWTHYVAIDTHPRTEQALVFVAVDEHDRVHVVHEIFKHGTPDQVAEWITDYHEDVHQVYAAVIEPSSQGDANRGDTTYQIIVKKLSAHSIPVYLGSKDLSSGIQIMREALCSANQQSSLFVFDTCTRLVFEFLNYIWKDWAKATDRNEQQKPRDKDDHLIEDLRRLLQLPVRYVDPRQLNVLLAQANRGFKPRDPIAGV